MIYCVLMKKNYYYGEAIAVKYSEYYRLNEFYKKDEKNLGLKLEVIDKKTFKKINRSISFCDSNINFYDEVRKCKKTKELQTENC